MAPVRSFVQNILNESLLYSCIISYLNSVTSENSVPSEKEPESASSVTARGGRFATFSCWSVCEVPSVWMPVDQIVDVYQNTSLVCAIPMTDCMIAYSKQVPLQRHDCVNTGEQYGSRTSTGCLCERILYIQINCVIIRFVKQSMWSLFWWICLHFYVHGISILLQKMK